MVYVRKNSGRKNLNDLDGQHLMRKVLHHKRSTLVSPELARNHDQLP